jgi:large subunit ribosomal protein L32e
MSKRFKAQDHFRYKRLGKRWRRPVGWQSKLRIGKGGSGMSVSIGYRSPVVSRGKTGGATVVNVYNVDDLSKIGSNGACRIAAGVGAMKTKLIQAKAKEMSIRIVNMKKIRRADKISGAIEKRRTDKVKEKKKEAEKKAIEKKAAEAKPEPKTEVKTEEKAVSEAEEKNAGNSKAGGQS